jgi:hypothetical protein
MVPDATNNLNGRQGNCCRYNSEPSGVNPEIFQGVSATSQDPAQALSSVRCES